MLRVKKDLKSQKRQQGVALITTLFMLLLMIIIGMAGMRTSTLEERMSANLRDRSIAFQSAESAMTEAEAIAESLVHLAQFQDGTPGYYSSTDNLDSPWETINWTDNNEVVVSTTTVLPEAADFPRYIIEHFTEVTSEENKLNMGNYGQNVGAGDFEIFRVTALGTGASTTSKVMVQTSYGKRF